MMKLTPIEVFIVLVALQSAEGLLNDAVNLGRTTRRYQATIHSMRPTKVTLSPPCSLSSDHCDSGTDDADVSRRTFINCVTTTAITALGLGMNVDVQDASAVDIPAPGSIKGNQRAGGLANKIRNSCRIMVRFIA